MSLSASQSSVRVSYIPSEWIETAVFWLLVVLMVALIAVAGPILTSDGPGHVAIAHAIVVAGDPAWPMVNRLYDINPILTPNALGHYLLAGLMLVMPPLAAEQALQILCTAGIPLAGRLVLRQLNPSATWLALFFFPVALQATFLMGLYNYTLSVAGCLLCIWATLRLQVSPSPGAVLLLAVTLLLTLACQASGWMEAIVAIGTLAGAEAVVRLWRRERLAAVALRHPPRC